jgi:hypothetical protein
VFRFVLNVRVAAALEEGLEESMAGSDPVSVTQPPKIKPEDEA